MPALVENDDPMSVGIGDVQPAAGNRNGERRVQNALVPGLFPGRSDLAHKFHLLVRG